MTDSVSQATSRPHRKQAHILQEFLWASIPPTKHLGMLFCGRKVYEWKGKTITKNKKQRAQNSRLGGRGPHEVPPPAEDLLAIVDAEERQRQFSSQMQVPRGSRRWSYSYANTGNTLCSQWFFLFFFFCTWSWEKIGVGTGVKLKGREMGGLDKSTFTCMYDILNKRRKKG